MNSEKFDTLFVLHSRLSWYDSRRRVFGAADMHLLIFLSLRESFTVDDQEHMLLNSLTTVLQWEEIGMLILTSSAKIKRPELR